MKIANGGVDVDHQHAMGNAPSTRTVPEPEDAPLTAHVTPPEQQSTPQAPNHAAPTNTNGHPLPTVTPQPPEPETDDDDADLAQLKAVWGRASKATRDAFWDYLDA